MLFVGVDLHQETITIAVVDAARKLVSRKRFSNLHTDQILACLRLPRDFELTVEATASYEWFLQLVEPLARRVLLAHPGKLRVIAESTRKSDNLDALTLAEMLAQGQIPTAYRPTPRQREHRTYVRHRQFWQRRLTCLRNKIRRVLSNYNLDREDLFTEAGREYLSGLVLLDADRFTIDQYLGQWHGTRKQLKQTDAALKKFAEAGSAQEQEDRRLLRAIPGVGPITTDVILAELADWQRFGSLKKVISYAGLAPGQRESAGTRKALHIEKTGSPLLRWILVQAAWQIVKRSRRWQAIYLKLKARIGGKKSIIALSRRLLDLCYSVLKSRHDYLEKPLPHSEAA